MRGLKLQSNSRTKSRNVAPLVGAWIETVALRTENTEDNVAPLVGAWIETRYVQTRSEQMEVAPLVGAWIETDATIDINPQIKSHPSWVRGLKHR